MNNDKFILMNLEKSKTTFKTYPAVQIFKDNNY
jgi:hypothetical protein